MPASGAVDGGLCAVGAGGEVERGVGRYSSAIYGKEEGMEKIEIREDKVTLNGQELKTLTEFEIKSTAEDGYAVVKLTLLAKLT